MCENFCEESVGEEEGEGSEEEVEGEGSIHDIINQMIYVFTHSQKKNPELVYM